MNLKKMTVEAAVLLVLTLSVTSVGCYDGDLLQNVCEEACQNWENLRRQCFKVRCQQLVDKGKDWFPCFLTCWKKSRRCLSLCADNFWDTYAPCSRQCFGRAKRKRRKCRHACAVRMFKDLRKKLVRPKIRKVKVTVGRRSPSEHT